MSLRKLLPTLLIIAAGAACSAAPPLADTRDSAAALAAAMLDALARHDRAALEALALSDAEFRGHVWPELPAARPERNLPYSYVWGELSQKSRMALARTLSTHGGARYSLQRVEFSGETTYPGYVVHREAALIVRDPAGVERRVRVCGSMLEQDGAWKVFSYVVED